jgi:Uma2 family endonuclease
MSTRTHPPTLPQPAPGPGRVVIYNVEWDAYRTISRVLAGRHVRLTYDRGTLELMTISGTHGNCGWLLGRLIAVLSEEHELPIKGFSDMTCSREDLARGLEPDHCFYITNEPLVRQLEDIDLEQDPPPDLGIEVDISRSSQSRMGIYAALKVPEVWRYDGASLVFNRLNAKGQYDVATQSGFFPQIAAAEIAGFLARRTELDETSLVRAFRGRVRQLLNKSDPPA